MLQPPHMGHCLGSILLSSTHLCPHLRHTQSATFFHSLQASISNFEHLIFSIENETIHGIGGFTVFFCLSALQILPQLFSVCTKFCCHILGICRREFELFRLVVSILCLRREQNHIFRRLLFEARSHSQ
jgi:hypothetical protein